MPIALCPPGSIEAAPGFGVLLAVPPTVSAASHCLLAAAVAVSAAVQAAALAVTVTSLRFSSPPAIAGFLGTSTAIATFVVHRAVVRGHLIRRVAAALSVDFAAMAILWNGTSHRVSA